jgi:hypothetical protein
MLWDQRYGNAIDPIPPMQYEPVKKSINTEEMLGKNIMGIAASVLIFISFILFATLMIPLLTDGMKVTLMLTVSIGITAFGLIMWFKKDRKSTFFLSLAACGVGAVYISLFMCNAYFHIINDLVLYFMILLWAGGVLFLSKYKQRLFEIIGEVGILVSIVFGCYSCVSNSDSTMLMILTVYSIIGVTAFLAFRIQDNISLIIHGAFGLVALLALTISDYGIIHSEGHVTEISISLVFLAAFSIGIIILYMLKLNKENSSYLPILCMLANVILYFDVYYLIPKDKPSWIAVMILAINIYVMLEYFKLKWKDRLTEGLYSVLMEIWQLLEIAIIYVCIMNVKELREYAGAALIAIPLLIYGFIKSDRLTQIKGLVAFGILAFSINLELPSFTLLPLTAFLIITFFMVIKRNEYHVAVKGASYAIYLPSLMLLYIRYTDEFHLNNDQSVVGFLFLFGSLNLAALLTPYGKSWLTLDEEKSFRIITYVINALLMLFSLYALNEVSDPLMHFMTVLGAIGLFCINVRRLLKEKETLPSIYVGVKFTILVMCILASYDAENYVLSISAFILAIIFIVVGFVLDIKSIRIYGLVVSMICVVKLVMIDITYENTMGHAISFFISGVLCFVISAVYSLAEKKLRKAG